MQSYDMSAPEGMALMTLCEALLRTPDPATQDELIKDKLTNAQWIIYLTKVFIQEQQV